MTATFKTSIRGVKTYSTNSLQNIVAEATIQIDATQNGITKSSFIPVQLDTPDQSAFLDYQSLTENQIIDWITVKLGQNEIDSLKHGLQSLLDEITDLPVNPIPQSIELPWVTT